MATALTIGENYEDRFIKGTGIEEDPFIIGDYPDEDMDSRFTNLLDALATSGAYVKLASDIDVSKSKIYRNGITEPLTIKTTSFYADENKKAIKNLIVQNNYLIDFHFNGEQRIENIQFLNFIHKGEHLDLFIRYSSAVLRNCDFSVLKNCLHNQNYYAFNSHERLDAEFCSFDVKIVNYGSPSVTSMFSGLKHCQVNYEGPLPASQDHGLLNKSSYTGITGFLKLNAINSKYYPRYKLISSDCSFCYFAGQIEGIVKISDRDETIVFYNDGNIALICPENVGEIPLEYNNFTIVSPEQLKSKEYLYELGFLP